MSDEGIRNYVAGMSDADQAVCNLLRQLIDTGLAAAEGKVWHGHPVWFVEGNPIVGFSRQKAGIRLMFWSGADFGEDRLEAGAGRFRDASVFYRSADEIDPEEVACWLSKSETIQWDYKNLAKRKGRLERLK